MKKNLFITTAAASVALAVFAATPAQAAVFTIPSTTTNCSGVNANVLNVTVNLDCNGLNTNPTPTPTTQPTTTPSTTPTATPTVAPTTAAATPTPQPTTTATSGVNANVTADTNGVTVNVNTNGNGGGNTDVNVPQTPQPTASAPTTPTVPTPTPTTPTTPDNPATPTSTTVVTPAPQPTDTTVKVIPAQFDNLLLGASSANIYPVKDGYRDSVTFSIRAMSANSGDVNISGKAVLTLGTKIIKTWTVNGSTDTITWDGLNGKKIRTGLYKLTVIASSPDGTAKSASTDIRVMPHRLVNRVAVVTSKSTVGATATTATMPKAVEKSLVYGNVTVRVRTVATVHGKAALVFVNKNAKRTVALKNGTHTTRELLVPAGFKRVTIKHQWKKGTVNLKSVQALWSYKQLVK